MTQEKLNEALKLHEMWLEGNGGKKADLSYRHLRDTDLSGTDLSYADLSGTDLSYADLSYADLSYADLSYADLSYANLSYANLSCADLSNTNLNGVDLSNADLSNTSLNGASLSDANLSFANLNGANLSDTTGLINPIDYLDKNFEKTEEGYIVYKTFGMYYSIPNNWEIKPNCIIEEEVNCNRSNNCGCGINIATKRWVELANVNHKLPIWKLLIKWEWLPSVVVPYNTVGKIRCGKAMLLEVINE